jgi:tricorn protease
MGKQLIVKMVFVALAGAATCMRAAAGQPDPTREIFLATSPAVAPDGSYFVFEWCNRLWKAPLAEPSGTITALPLTDGKTRESSPVISPDGTRVAFRAGHATGSFRIFELSLAEPSRHRQLSFHSELTLPYGYTSDGLSICAAAVREADDVRVGRKPILVATSGTGLETPLLDVRCDEPAVSPDGKKVLFVRFGDNMYRKRRGTSSPATGQIWCYDRVSSNFTCVVSTADDAASPRWLPDGSGFLYTRGQGGIRNLRLHTFAGADVPLTRYTDDHVLTPSLSADGSTVVYRHGFGFELMRIPAELRKNPSAFAVDSLRATSLRLVPAGGIPAQPPCRSRYTTATNIDESGSVDFTSDGAQIAFTAGGDLWVMDAVIRQPVRVYTATNAFVRECAFSPSGRTLYFIADRGDGTFVARARCASASLPWWENVDFDCRVLVSDDAFRKNLSVSPDGKLLAWGDRKGRLSIAGIDGKLLARLPASSATSACAWHPSSRLIAFAMRDRNANYDVWLAWLPDFGKAAGRPVEIAKRDCLNVSRYWAWDGMPTFSPDGKLLAFVGERTETAAHINYYIFYVYFNAADEASDNEAWKQLEQARKATAEKNEAAGKEKSLAKNVLKGAVEKLKTEGKPKAAKTSGAHAVAPVRDERLPERVRRVRVAVAANPVFSHDSRTLAFTANAQVSTIHIPDRRSATKRLGTKTTVLRWIKDKDTLLGVTDQIPSVNEKKLMFTVQTERSRADFNELAFRTAWGSLRDTFYDPALHRTDWKAVRDLYLPYARNAPSADVFTRLCQKVLGEMDSSHMGFTPTLAAESDWGRWSGNQSGWQETTAHLGVEFVPEAEGWRVTRLLPETPLASLRGHPEAGDVILRIDGEKVSDATAPARVLSVPDGHRFRVTFRHGTLTNTVFAAGITFEKAREKACARAIAARCDRVHAATGGRVGYIHVKQMNIDSLVAFEEKLAAEGMDKEALIVDVRDNGGGYIADRLLEVLSGPRHGRFRSRGATDWGYGDIRNRHRPLLSDVRLVVLANQWSCSNAEIFTHAIKSLRRGTVVGTPTCGAVIGTASRQVFDFGTLRLPGTWWKTADGTDMEHHPAQPDVPVALTPADEAAGRDPQLEKAIELALKAE